MTSAALLRHSEVPAVIPSAARNLSSSYGHDISCPLVRRGLRAHCNRHSARLSARVEAVILGDVTRHSEPVCRTRAKRSEPSSEAGNLPSIADHHPCSTSLRDNPHPRPAYFWPLLPSGNDLPLLAVKPRSPPAAARPGVPKHPATFPLAL
jgi:hypothetical protein